MKTTTMKILKLMAIVLVTTLSVSASAQVSHPVKAFKETREIRSDKRDIHMDQKDRGNGAKEIVSDKRDMNHDRKELANDVAHGRKGQVIADKADLRNDRRDIRGDKRDIVKDTRDIHADKRDLKHDKLKRRRDTL